MTIGGKMPPRLPPVFAPDRSHPMVDDFTLRAMRHQAKQAPGTLVVAPIPLRQHPMWDGNNELGRSAAFAPDSNNRQMILKLGAWNMPEVWTGMLGISYSDGGFTANSALLGVTAELQFGSGGAVQEVEIDWVEGVQFSAPMNSLVVTAKYAASATSIPTDIVLTATAGCRQRPGGIKPTLSVQVPSLVTGGGTVQSAAVRIPAFARRVSIIDRGTTGAAYGANFSLIFVSNPVAGAGSVGQINGDILLNFMPNGISIPKFANYIILEARNPAVSSSPTLVFEIDL